MHIKNKKENTMKPFELGDIFLGCTELVEDIDDHKGNGRILQYDKDFNLKGILWTEGTDHLVIGLKICLLYTSPSPRDRQKSRMPSSA